MPPRRPMLALLVLLALLATPVLADDTVLMFEHSVRSLERVTQSGRRPRSDSSRTVVTLVLGTHGFKVYEGQQIWIYDFSRNRLACVRTEDRIYSEWPLHAYAAFHELELQSRLGLRDGGPGEPPPGVHVRDVETLLGIEADETKAAPGDTVADVSVPGEARITLRGGVAATASASSHPLNPAQIRLLERFLIYRAHLHPRARAAVLRLGVVPQVLFFRYRDGNVETAELYTLTKVTSTEANDPTHGLVRNDLPEKSLEKLAARVEASRRHCGSPADTGWQEASRKFEAAALDGGRFLDAALAGLERSMRDGKRPSSQMWAPRVRDRAQADTALAAYVSASTWTDEAGAARALGRLDSLDRRGLQKGHVLDFIASKAALTARNLEAGFARAFRGLDASPCASEIWLDLSAALLKDYQTVLAWVCLERARASTPPGSSLLADGLEYERDLERRRPEFFGPIAQP